MGISYPIKSPNISVSEYYDAVVSYGIKETLLIMKYMEILNPSKTIEPMKTETRQQFGRPYYDD